MYTCIGLIMLIASTAYVVCWSFACGSQSVQLNLGTTQNSYIKFTVKLNLRHEDMSKMYDMLKIYDIINVLVFYINSEIETTEI